MVEQLQLTAELYAADKARQIGLHGVFVCLRYIVIIFIFSNKNIEGSPLGN